MAITEQRSEAAADAAHGIGPRRHPIAAWLTTTDHKKIGIMYLVNSYFWFGVAGLLAVFIRAELANPGTQYFGEERYNQLFTMHGTTMIFLFVIPMLAGFGNYIVPLQIGALDMAFPRVNALSFWMLPLAGLVLYSSYLLGGPADAGWTQYAPLSEGVGTQGNAIGIDLWIVALLLVGTASILGAVNFITTIFNMRAPGMTMFRMPLFTWTILVTSLLVLLATPVFTSALVMLLIDRNLGGSFFNPANGGIAVLWQNVFWSTPTRRCT
jgi:cytochrome c oxidase subunit 1